MSVQKTGAIVALLAVMAMVGWWMSGKDALTTPTTPIADVATTVEPSQQTAQPDEEIGPYGIGEPMTFRSANDIDTSSFFLSEENPDWLKSFTDEQLKTVIAEDQPYGPAAMAVLGLRLIKRGSVQPGSKWLLKHFEVTGKPGPLHSATYWLGKGEEKQLVLYQFMSILVATKYPIYSQEKLDKQRGDLSGAKEKLDAIDREVARLLGVTSNKNAAGSSRDNMTSGGAS